MQGSKPYLWNTGRMLFLWLANLFHLIIYGYISHMCNQPIRLSHFSLNYSFKQYKFTIVNLPQTRSCLELVLDLYVAHVARADSLKPLRNCSTKFWQPSPQSAALHRLWPCVGSQIDRKTCEIRRFARNLPRCVLCLTVRSLGRFLSCWSRASSSVSWSLLVTVSVV